MNPVQSTTVSTEITEIQEDSPLEIHYQGSQELVEETKPKGLDHVIINPTVRSTITVVYKKTPASRDDSKQGYSGTYALAAAKQKPLAPRRAQKGTLQVGKTQLSEKEKLAQEVANQRAQMARQIIYQKEQIHHKCIGKDDKHYLYF